MPTKDSVKKWTPGPWHLHDMESFTVCGPDHLAISLSEARSRSDEENDANTKLIAKAPEMADLLQILSTVSYYRQSFVEAAEKAQDILHALEAK